MDQKGITKRQFWIQMIPAFFYILLAGFWIANGILDGETIQWVLGSIFLVLSITMVIHLIIQRKHHLIEDAQLDEMAARNMKDGMKGMGIFYGIITVAFLVAFGLAALLS